MREISECFFIETRPGKEKKKVDQGAEKKMRRRAMFSEGQKKG